MRLRCLPGCYGYIGWGYWDIAPSYCEYPNRRNDVATGRPIWILKSHGAADIGTGSNRTTRRDKFATTGAERGARAPRPASFSPPRVFRDTCAGLPNRRAIDKLRRIYIITDHLPGRQATPRERDPLQLPFSGVVVSIWPRLAYSPEIRQTPPPTPSPPLTIPSPRVKPSVIAPLVGNSRGVGDACRPIRPIRPVGLAGPKWAIFCVAEAARAALEFA